MALSHVKMLNANTTLDVTAVTFNPFFTISTAGASPSRQLNGKSCKIKKMRSKHLSVILL